VIKVAPQFISHGHFPDFVGRLMAITPVVAPVAKKNKFVFARLERAEDLRLDYDVTLLPPKKVFFPVKQDLVAFSPQGVRSCIEPEPLVLLGVHFYDVKAIDQLDYLFRENQVDYNYLAQRECTTIVGSSVQTVSRRAFFASVGVASKARGMDTFLTKLPDGYLFEVFTPKGEKLLPHGRFQAALPEQVQQAKKAVEESMAKCPEKLKYSSSEIADRVRKAFKSPVWKELAARCFSCGTCNIVCPTCYCFDVQDHWALDQVSGTRARAWDGCLTEEFAKISLGAGACENFREHREERFRHRVMRKAAYLNPKLGGPACVGCGRCSAGCVPDIADPVAVIHRLMED
jgi:ferredoxin